MKTAIIAVSVASALASACSLNAQMKATITRLSDDMTGITVRNNAPVAISAFALYLTYVHRTRDEDTPLILYFDPATDPTVPPLAANEERVVRPERVIIGNARGKFGFPLFQQRIVVAAIHADGSTEGDASLLTRMILRRSNLLLAIETTRDMLMTAGRHNIPRDELVAQFKRMAASLDHWYLLPEQQIGREIYLSILGKVINLPEQPVGTPFPPAGFVSRETAILNVQRTALSESEPRLGDSRPIGAALAFQNR